MYSLWRKVNEGTITFNTAEELWRLACEYFKDMDDNPIIVKKTLLSGKDAGRPMNVEKARPYSIKGICLYCGITEEYFKDVRMSQNKDSEYYIVVSKIMYIVYNQVMEMTLIGEYTPIFATKMLGIDKQDDSPVSAIRVEIVSDKIPTLSTSENDILDKLELENPEWKTFREQS